MTNLVSSGLAGYGLLVTTNLYCSNRAYPWDSPVFTTSPVLISSSI